MKLTEENIEAVIDEEINPSLAMHQGFIQLAGLEGDKVVVSFHGGCSGCPRSKGATLRSIQLYLREHFNIESLTVENADIAE